MMSAVNILTLESFAILAASWETHTLARKRTSERKHHPGLRHKNGHRFANDEQNVEEEKMREQNRISVKGHAAAMQAWGGQPKAIGCADIANSRYLGCELVQFTPA